MPHRLGRYAVRRRIGSGGFATVWLAYDEQLDSPVAVKVLAENWTEDTHVRRRFVEEGRYLRKVESPHVVSVYDAGELDDGRPYLVMSYADQGTLADRLEAGGLTSAQTLEVVRQVGAGLQALHDRDVLHRDVKPANVLFRTVRGPRGDEVRAMVGDLGLGKALDVSSRLTMVAGTPTFVSPEQASAESPDARADQYSLAALAYLLLSGRPPFAHVSLAAAQSPGELAPLSVPEREFPGEVDAVLRRALAPDREERFPDVTAFVTAFAEALDGVVDADARTQVTRPWLERDPDLTQPGPRPTQAPAAATLPVAAAPRRRRAWPVLVGVGIVALALGAGGGWAVQRASQPTERTVFDSDGNISVTVPASWDRADAVDDWQPPGSSDEVSALSVGTDPTWNEGDGEGVFAALLEGDSLPDQVPQHPECASAGRAVEDTQDGDSSVTVVYSGCPGTDGAVVVERVVQVTRNTLLWVQVRSGDRPTAAQVLDGVETHGI
ncbi:serine/threonine-protein kinase [Nocardioides flavescens]|uniref:serine/threonine-protein kinase n=1 Tax=Nocardioides flavescens TaxID=2691959 RepID=UPI0019272EF8|nr:serine/threonine-protein kinase [Nocardioides flavescens]